MKQLTITVYTFDELSEPAKDKARGWILEWYPENDWYESVYDDAKTIGLKINGFDIDRGNYCQGEFTTDEKEVTKRILKNHGRDCDTYKDSVNFLRGLKAIVFNPENNYQVDDGNFLLTGEAEERKLELEQDFLKSLLDDYRIILRREYDYMCSREQIDEMIKTNEYTFTKDGKREG
jgi:hypothetical protein